MPKRTSAEEAPRHPQGESKARSPEEPPGDSQTSRHPRGGGLVRVQQAGRERCYTLTPEPLGELEQWVQEIGATWEARLLRLKTWLEQPPPDE